MVRTAVRNTGCALIRVLNYTVISAISTSAEVTSNLISAVLRCYTIILLTLVTLYNMIFLRVDINIIILIIQKNVISYCKVNLS